MNLARELYKKYTLSTRQLSILTKLPEEEICKYFKEIIKNRKSIFFNKKNRKTSYDINDYNTAKEALRNVKDELEKRALTEELEKAKKIIDLKQRI